jgi:hypothetical protein
VQQPCFKLPQDHHGNLNLNATGNAPPMILLPPSVRLGVTVARYPGPFKLWSES